uniref:Uncharacterized protein n=1 Tax=Parascaris univalens TaxID=6257 RepID=A0A915B6Z1_PARUN
LYCINSMVCSLNGRNFLSSNHNKYGQYVRPRFI